MAIPVANQNIEVNRWWQLALWALLATLLVKLLMSVIRSLQTKKNFSLCLLTNDLGNSDYYVSFGLGTIELLIYPVLIRLGCWQGITWWLGIKTAARWRWKPRKTEKETEEQASRRYTNYIFGNAVVILASFILTHVVRIK